MKNQLLGKVGKVLDAVIASETPLTLQLLAEMLDMPTATVGRITADLTEMNLLEKVDYHTFAPAPGMARFGLAAQEKSQLLKKAVPLIDDFVSALKMNAVLVMFDGGYISKLYLCGEKISPGYIYRSGVEVMALAASGIDQKEAFDILNRKYPGISGTERLLLERELTQAEKSGALLRVKSMYECSFALPFYFNDKLYTLAVYGVLPETSTQERFCFDCSLLVSKIVSA